MKRNSVRLVGCAAAAGGALLLSSCAAPSAPVAANHPTSTATVSELGPFPGHRPGRVQPVPPPKTVVPAPKAVAPKPAAPKAVAPKPAAPKPAPKPVYKPAAPRPVYKPAPAPAPAPAPKPAPKPAPAGPAYLSNFTCKVLGPDSYRIAFTLHRPPASSVPFPAFTWSGSTYVGQVTYNGTSYAVDKDFSHECGL